MFLAHTSARPRASLLLTAWCCSAAALLALAPLSPAAAGKPAVSRVVKVGDQLVRLTAGSHDVALVEDASGGSPRWHVQVPMGGADVSFSDDQVMPVGTHQLLIGWGPASLVDVADGRVLWTLPDDKLGTLDFGSTYVLAGDRILSLGSKKSNATQLEMAKNPRLVAIDLAGGRVLWSRDVDPHEHDVKYGSFWQRYQAIRAGRSTVKERQYETHVEAVRRDGATSEVAGAAEANQVLVVGNHVMGLDLADGHVLWEVKDGGGVLTGVYGHRVYMRYGDDLRTFDIGSGEKGWTLDLTGKGATVYGPDDMLARDMTPPEGMDYLLVSEHKVVSRVDPENGKVTWTVPREDHSWFATQHALLVFGKGGTIAYDYATGKKLWTFTANEKTRPFTGGDVVLLVDRGAESNGVHKGPYALWAVNGTDGTVLWSRTEVGGRKIARWKLGDDGVVAMFPDKGAEERVQLATGADAGGK